MKLNLIFLFAKVALVVGYSAPILCFAQAGNMDSTFSYDGYSGVSFGIGESRATCVAVQADGKIVVGGYFAASGDFDFALTRYKTNGDPDSSFGINGKKVVDFDGYNDYANAISIQSDGKILLAGTIYYFTGYSQDIFGIMRFDTSGNLDPTFSADGKAFAYFGSGDQYCYGMDLQADGKIVLVGHTTFNPTPGDYQICVARFNTNGGLDLSFSSNGLINYNLAGTGYDAYAYDVEIQTNGKYIISGYVSGATANNMVIMRINSDGTFDNSFDGNGMAVFPDVGPSDACLQPDGKILVTGNTGGDIFVGRFKTDGIIDSTFDSDGYTILAPSTTSNLARGIALQSDGKIVISGSSLSAASDYEFTVIRLNPDGSPDPLFSGDGIFTLQFIGNDHTFYDVTVQADDKIIATGQAGTGGFGNFATIRLKSCSNSGSTQNFENCIEYTWPENGQTYTSSGTYFVVYPNATGCDSVVSLDLIINSLPNNAVNQSGTTLTSLQSGATYQWLDCNDSDNPIPGETGQSFTATVDGSYRVWVIKNDCENFSNCKTVTIPPPPSGVLKHEFIGFGISPNPSSDKITISSQVNMETITIFDISGKVMYQEILNSKNLQIMVADFPAGLYTVKVTGLNGKTESSGFLKQ